MVKYFRFDFDYVMWGISFQNLNMLLATIPVYESDEEKKEKAKSHESMADMMNDDSIKELFK